MTDINLNEAIKEARPKASENTVKMYVSNLNKLKKIFDTDNFKFLDNPDKVMDQLKDKHYTTIRNYLNAIIVLLLALDKDKKLIEKYKKMRDDRNKEYEDFNATGKISDKQKENFVELSEITKMINKMGEDLKGFKKRDLNAKDKMLLQVYIIYQIHIRLPLRNDLAEMEAIMKRTYNNLSDDDKKSKNWLIVEKSNMWMSLNKFKTKAKYEELKFEVPKDLEKLLRSYLKINGMGVLFKSSTGKALSRNQLSQLLLKYSKRYINKSISTTILRKIVLSDKFGALKKEQKDMAKITGHSVETMNEVYIKDKQDKQDKS